jgi:hypothetical protein
LNAGLRGSFSSQNFSLTETSDDRRGKGTTLSQLWYLDLDWQGSSYVDKDFLYWYVGFEGSGWYEGRKNHEEGSDGSATWETHGRYKYRGYDVRMNAGCGIGKVRDGLPVYTVLRIIDRLREDSALLREPKREEILQLVQIYSRISEYLGKYERYTKYLFGDLFAAMESMGIVDRNGLAVYSIVHTMDVLMEYHTPRLFGWRIQAGLEHHSSQEESFYTSSFQRSKTGVDYLKMSGEIGHDLSLDAHAHAVINVRTGLFTRYLRFLEFEGRGTLTYDLGERIEFRLIIEYMRSHNWVNSGTLLEPFQRQTTFRTSLNTRFFIEDRVSLSVESSYDFRRNSRRFPAPDATANTEKGTNASIRLDYRFF